jgi:hypothetical protein
MCRIANDRLRLGHSLPIFARRRLAARSANSFMFKFRPGKFENFGNEASVAFDLSPEFLLCPARALLQTSEQLVFLAFGVSKIIVGELRVFLLQLSLHLVPSAFECEFVHSHFSFGTSVLVARKGYSGSGSACGITPRRLTALSAPPPKYAVVPVEQAVPLPAGVSAEQGAGLGIPGITAHRAVHVAGQVEGRTVLVQGGAGAVGAWAMQLAHRAGARVIATCREAGLDPSR